MNKCMDIHFQLKGGNAVEVMGADAGLAPQIVQQLNAPRGERIVVAFWNEDGSPHGIVDLDEVQAAFFDYHPDAIKVDP